MKAEDFYPHSFFFPKKSLSLPSDYSIGHVRLRKDRCFHGNRPLFDILQQSYCPFRSAKAERSEKAASVPIAVYFKNHSALAERKGKENNSLCNNN